MVVEQHSLVAKAAAADHPIHDLVRRRWSPRAFAARPIAPAVISSLFEAARWAPSAGNGQPWSFIVADRSRAPEDFARMLDLLNPKNQTWAQHAPLLLIGVTQRIRDEGKEARHALYDLGMATENLVLQAVDLGLAAHQMAGFDHERPRGLRNPRRARGDRRDRDRLPGPPRQPARRPPGARTRRAPAQTPLRLRLQRSLRHQRRPGYVAFHRHEQIDTARGIAALRRSDRFLAVRSEAAATHPVREGG